MKTTLHLLKTVFPSEVLIIFTYFEKIKLVPRENLKIMKNLTVSITVIKSIAVIKSITLISDICLEILKSGLLPFIKRFSGPNESMEVWTFCSLVQHAGSSGNDAHVVIVTFNLMHGSLRNFFNFS